MGLGMEVSIIAGELFDSTSFFAESTAQLLELMEDRATTFVFSDRYPIIAIFFHKRGYRRCEMYHVGDQPKHNIGKYKLNGGHASYAVIDTTLEQCDRVIRV
jgi:hypothetical protein